jgi:CRISPR-associated protein Cmr3
MNTTTLRFTALDTLFFRESRPFEAIGGSELTSLFPPPPRTVAGAIRSAIGDALGADWQAFHQNIKGYSVNGINLRTLIGGDGGDDMGKLHLEGIWLAENGARLYPTPLFLLCKDKDTVLRRLEIGNADRTSLGRVRLPRLPEGCAGYKPLENVWLTSAGLEKVLQGAVPDAADLRLAAKLFSEEPRLGIARDNQLRTAQNGLLYQSRHIRPNRKVGLSIEADVTGLDDLDIFHRIVRLGGEGRMAGIESISAQPFPNAPKPNGNKQGLMMILVTPARFDGPAWLPTGFAQEENNNCRVWRGVLNGISLTIHCAVLGKPLREGGWDMAKKCPRPVQSLLPAGSAWYCTVNNGDLAKAIVALHDKQIGEDQQLGRGRIVCGLWNDKLTTQKHGEA